MNEFSSFVTNGFDGVISPMLRVTHEVLEGWNLIVLAAVMLLVVLNKQLYPRLFRQLLTVPGGVSYTNQLLREGTPMKSFSGFSFTLCYIMVTSLFIQKACVLFSRDISQYNGIQVYGICCGCVGAWILLRFLVLAFNGWLFNQKEVVARQNTVELAVSTIGFLVMVPILLLVLYIPNSLFIWIGIGILFILALTRLILGFIETRVFTKIPSFYIFLYLCSLEIVPFVLLLVAGLRFFANHTVF